MNNRTGLGLNAGVISTVSGDTREWLALASLSAGFTLTGQIGAYPEVYAEMPQDVIWMPTVDGGFTVQLNTQIQLDFYTGKGLNNTAPGWIFGSGLSFRLHY